MVRASHRATTDGVTDWRAVVDQYIRSDRTSAWVDGVDIMILPWPGGRQKALIRYVGTLLARINLDRNRRLHAALSTKSYEARQRELAERLPSAVIQALGEASANADPQTILSRATLLLEHEARPRRRYRPRKNQLDGEPQPWPVRPGTYDPARTAIHMLSCGTPPDVVDQALRQQGLGSLQETVTRIAHWQPDLHREYEVILAARPWAQVSEFEMFANVEDASALLADDLLDFSLHEEAATVANSAGLSQREAEVLALVEAGLRPVQIARRLGIAASTARVHVLNMRKKVRSIA
jgi:DNA-binding CsgD family transcriptional regulator